VALEAALATARATVVTLEAALAAEAGCGGDDEVLDLAALHERYHLGRSAVRQAIERGELKASRGAKGRILVRREAVEGWLSERPAVVSPRPRFTDSGSLAEWDRAQELELRRVAGAGSGSSVGERSHVRPK